MADDDQVTVKVTVEILSRLIFEEQGATPGLGMIQCRGLAVRIMERLGEYQIGTDKLTLEFYERAKDIVIPEQIREARVGNGLTQEALADLIESYGSYVTRLERGQVPPGLGKLMDIAEALDLPLVIGPQLKEKAKRWRSKRRPRRST